MFIKIFLFLATGVSCVALAAKQNMVRTESNYPVDHRRNITSAAAPVGKAKTFVFIGSNASNTFLLPANKATCDSVFQEFKEAIDFNSLEKMGTESDLHVYYQIGHWRVHDDSEIGNTDYCDTNEKGQLIVKLTAVVQAADAEGNDFLEEYTKRMKTRKFYDYKIQWQKPIQIITRFELEHWGSAAESGWTPQMNYYKARTEEFLGDTEPEFDLLVAVLDEPQNKQKLVEFFQARTDKPEEVEKIIQRFSEYIHTTKITLTMNPIYVLESQSGQKAVTGTNFGFNFVFEYRCPAVGSCYR